MRLGCFPKNPKQIHSWVFPIPTSEGLGFLEASSRYVSAREPQQKITNCENPQLKTSFFDAEKCQKILSGHNYGNMTKSCGT